MKKVIMLSLVVALLACTSSTNKGSSAKKSSSAKKGSTEQIDASTQTGIRFEKGSLKTAMEKAGEENKYLFVDVYTTWCPPCKYMSDNVFTQQSVGDYFNEIFVNVKVDAERGEGPSLLRRYGVEAFPTFLLLDGNGKLVGKIVGFGEFVDEGVDGFVFVVEKFIEKFKKLKEKADAQSEN